MQRRHTCQQQFKSVRERLESVLEVVFHSNSIQQVL